ncbi:carbohydrate kinase [Zunongwangia sp. SCSIO 43204]|nr:carbohydrate kinase [Zunongwangia sp. SCSIO 43204]
MKTNKIAVCFGEVLWDVFKDSKKIGGAPMNAAVRMGAEGIDTYMISAVGEDEPGKEILKSLKKLKIRIDSIATNSYPTGEVLVNLDGRGSATYDILYPRAWDKIRITEKEYQLVRSADIFLYGSLACRDELTRNSLASLLKVAQYKVLDINLRVPYYNFDIIKFLLKESDFIKFNDDELFEISEIMGSPFFSLEQNIKFIQSISGAKSICVTKGRHGAVLLHESKYYYNSGFRTEVKDTVGAGDSFLATLIVQLLEKNKPQDAIDRACAVGALVAAKDGGNPILSTREISKFMNPIS